MRTFLYSLLVFMITPDAIAQWTAQQAPLNSALFFVNMQAADDVLISGAGKRIFQRGVSGSPWQHVPVTTSIDPFFNLDRIAGVQRINDTVMVAVLESLLEVQEFVLRTTDDGVSWQMVHTGPDFTGFLDMAYLPGDRCIAVGKSGRIVIGTNLAGMWSVLPTTAPGDLMDIDMWDAQTGYIVGEGVVLRTDDGGLSWEVAYAGPEQFRSVSAWGVDTVFATASETADGLGPLVLLRSVNGGAEWEQVPTPFAPYVGLKTVSATTLYLAGYTGIYRSETAGASWFSFPEISTQSSITAIDFSDELNGVAVGLNGAILETNTGGGPGIPEAFFTVDTLSVCVGGSLLFSNRSPIGLTYQWSVAGVPFADTYNTLIDFNTPGYQTVTLTVTEGNLETTYSVTVYVRPPPVVPPFSVYFTGGAACQGTSRSFRVQLSTGGPAFRYNVNGTWVTDWSTSSPNWYEIVDVQQDVVIEIQCRVDGVCGPSYASAIDTLRVVPAAPTLQLDFESDSVCVGDTVQVILDPLDPSFTYRATWSSLQGNPIRTDQFTSSTGPETSLWSFVNSPIPSLSFTVIAYQQGCTTTVAPPTIFTAFPVYANIIATPQQAILGVPISLQNTSTGNNYQWTFPASAQPQTSVLPAPQVTFQQTGFEETIYLTVTNAAGCIDNDSMNVEVMLPVQTIDPAVCMEQTIGEPMVWVDQGYSMGLSYYYSPLDMVTDASGNSIITGCYRTSQGDYYGDALFISKFDRTGELIWDLRAPQLSSNHSSTGVALDVDPSGNLILAGLAGAFNNGWNFSFLGQNLGYSASSAGFIIKLDSNGQAIWSIKLTGDNWYEGVSDVLFLPDGGVVFAMNGSQNEREITFANGVTLPTGQVAPPFGMRNLFLVKVDEFGNLVTVLPGSTKTSFTTGYSPGPVFSPIATFTNSSGYSPLSPRLSLSCDGSLQVWSTQIGQHDLQGVLYGEPDTYYHALSSTDTDLSNWNSHDLFATSICTEGRDILSRPIMLGGTRQNTTLLAISNEQVNTPICDTVCLLSNGTVIDVNGQSAVFLIDHETGEILWDRKLGGVGIKEIVSLSEDHFVVIGQAYRHASVMINGEVMGQNDLQLRDIVLFEFDLEGQFYGMTSLGSDVQDFACEATSNGCDEITMLASVAGEAVLTRFAMNGSCSLDPCTGLQIGQCNDTLAICAGQSVPLIWQFSGPLGPLSVIRTDDQDPDGLVLAENVDPTDGQFVWTPGPLMFNGQLVTLSLVDETSVTLDAVIVQLIPPIDVDLMSETSTACAGDSIALHASLGFASYAWSNGDVGSAQSFAYETGSFSVTVMDENGCSAARSIDLTILPGELFAQSDTAFCGVDEAALTAVQGFDLYEWSTGYVGPLSTQPIVASGTVTILASSAFGCQTADTIEVQFIPILTVSFIEQTVYCIGDSLSVSIEPDVPVEYAWGSGISTASHPILANTLFYPVTVTDAGGCSYSTFAFVQPEVCVGIDEHTSGTSLTIQPNPSVRYITVGHGTSVVSIDIIDMIGHHLFAVQVPLGQRTTVVDVSQFPSGAYILATGLAEGASDRTVFIRE